MDIFMSLSVTFIINKFKNLSIRSRVSSYGIVIMKTIQLVLSYLIGSPLYLYGCGFTSKASSFYASLALHFIVQLVEDGGVCGKSMSSYDRGWFQLVKRLNQFEIHLLNNVQNPQSLEGYNPLFLHVYICFLLYIYPHPKKERKRKRKEDLL